MFTGSYSYNLLTWRDIDVCLILKNDPTPKIMFEIGTELSKINNIATMYYRNEYILETKGNPKGMFWCIEIMFNNQLWKVDVLVSTKIVCDEVVKPGLDIISKLTPQKRETILEIKDILSQDKNYRKEFRSTDIYEAVLKNKVSTLDEWKTWWNKKGKLLQ
ncbi:MAG: hypothetical protein JW925_14175 [Syntrophaceae bacterium]|nr:hypothetical protein [Syntrophaceae bacterium]